MELRYMDNIKTDKYYLSKIEQNLERLLKVVCSYLCKPDSCLLGFVCGFLRLSKYKPI